jgi:hypothetical protein
MGKVVKIIYREGNGTIVVEASYGLAEIECPHNDGELLQQTFLPKLNAALKCIINYERDATAGRLSQIVGYQSTRRGKQMVGQ